MGTDKEQLIQEIRNKYEAVRRLPHEPVKLPEQLKRLRAAMIVEELEKQKTRWKSVKLVGEAIGMSPTTIRRGLRELQEFQTGLVSNFSVGRSPGGGRKKTVAIHTDTRKELEALIEPLTVYDSESPLRWTCKSLRQLAEELVQRKIIVCPNTVRSLLYEMGYSLQDNRKTRRINHLDRNAQFEYINHQVRDFLLARQPVVLVDTKKRGNSDKVISYNETDIAKDEGWVSTGINHNTAPFTANSIRRWWTEMGLHRFPQADRLLIIAEADDSNNYPMRLWKVVLQEISNDSQLDITVCHFPPGTSKWSKIERHLLSFSKQCQPFHDLVTIVNLIGNTATNEELTVHRVIDKTYEKGIKVRYDELKAISVQEHDFHGEWNYTTYKTYTIGQNDNRPM